MRQNLQRSDKDAAAGGGEAESSVELRSDFSETAFWEPHVVLEPDGSATVEFDVPDSVTDWNLWVHAITTDLRGGSATRQAQSVKELMVRPYLPRFLREGDRAVLKVVVNNAGEEAFEGALNFGNHRSRHRRGPPLHLRSDSRTDVGRAVRRRSRQGRRSLLSALRSLQGSAPWPSRSPPGLASSRTASCGRCRCCRAACT